jgi:hypothetical protein
MSQALWQLHQHSASLTTARFRATLPLERPHDGLVDVKLDQVPLGESRFLGIDVPPGEAAPAPTLADCYVRSAELVAAYEATSAWPVQIDAAWGALVPAVSSGSLAAVDVVVSVWTALLDSRPELSVRSTIAAEECWRLVAEQAETSNLPQPSGGPAVGAGRFEQIEPFPLSAATAWESPPGCFLFRLRASDASYVEMVHPADFCRDELAVEPGPPGRARAVHRLFAVRLEKGVILRSRVRGIFLPRSDDLAVAAAAYREFASEEPLLGR